MANNKPLCSSDEFDRLLEFYKDILQRPDYNSNYFKALKLMIIEGYSANKAAKTVTKNDNVKTIKRKIERKYKDYKIKLYRMRFKLNQEKK